MVAVHRERERERETQWYRLVTEAGTQTQFPAAGRFHSPDPALNSSRNKLTSVRAIGHSAVVNIALWISFYVVRLMQWWHLQYDACDSQSTHGNRTAQSRRSFCVTATYFRFICLSFCPLCGIIFILIMILFLFHLLSCVSMQCMQSAISLWRIRPSVCLSVQHGIVLCLSECTYRHNFFHDPAGTSF